MKCPGQDTRYWKPGAIFEEKCPKCGVLVEFFKDDTARKCKQCGHRFVNPNMDFGCASYCQYAEQCLGSLPDEVLNNREDLLKDRVAIEMKRYFRTDFKRIGHASKVARYAERIGKKEVGNLAVILTSAYLSDIGMPEAEKKYDSKAFEHHENEGVSIARSILEKLGAQENLIDEVEEIIAHHHHPGEHENTEFKVLYDAILLADLEDSVKAKSIEPSDLNTKINESFLTESGKLLACELFSCEQV